MLVFLVIFANLRSENLKQNTMLFRNRINNIYKLCKLFLNVNKWDIK